MKEPSQKQDLVRMIRQAGIYLSIPMVLAGGPTFGFFVGRFIDGHFSSDPWGITVSVALGLMAGVYQTIRLIRHAQRLSD